MKSLTLVLSIALLSADAMAHGFAAGNELKCRGAIGIYVIEEMTPTHLSGSIKGLPSGQSGNFQILRSHVSSGDCWHVQLDQPEETRVVEVVTEDPLISK